MSTLQIEKSKALVAFRNADPNGKKLLSDLFDPKVFTPKFSDLKTFEDCCEAIGLNPLEKEFTAGPSDEVAYRKLKVIARALNAGWVPNWNNSSQRKWAPWFYLDSPGFRFCGSYCSASNTHSTGGSRLCFETEELATYAGKQFLDIYKDFLTI